MAIATDWRQAPLTPADQAILAYCEKLTLAPGTLTRVDVDDLRAHGFTDREIVSIALAAAYRNYITRVADGLGAELRRTMDYAPEFIRAFGVDPDAARTTLYADRGGPTPPAPLPSREGGISGGDAVGAFTTQHSAETRRLTRQASPFLQKEGGPGGLGHPWVATTPPLEQATRFAALRTEWDTLTAPRAWSNLALVLAARPEALAVTLQHARVVDHGGSGLERWQEALIGLVVAATLRVPYLTLHHAEALLAQETPFANALALAVQPEEYERTTAGVARPLAAYCHKLTSAPGTTTSADVEELRGVGFTDAQIISVAGGVAFQAFLCGLAAGLGVAPESGGWVPAVLDLVAEASIDAIEA